MNANVLNLYVNKVEKEQVLVDSNGIKGDKHYAKNLERSILLLSTCSYDLASSNHIALEFGELSENILIDNDINHLETGSQVKIGHTLLEVTQHCTLCKSLTKINNKLPKLLKTDRGIFVKVIKEGTISKNDKVEFL